MATKTVAVLDESELQDGQMKEVDFEDGKVLLSKIGDKVHATSAFCTHYGAPLAKGVLTSTGRVTCPWHGACFNVCTGDIEDAPGPAAIHSFKTSVSNGKIHVEADPSLTTKEKKARPPTNRGAQKSLAGAGVVIVGGGSGALGAIIGLRESGYPGKITLLSKEPYAPIDRTKLSKALVTDAKQLEWYSAQDLKDKFQVDVQTGAEVSSVDTKAKTVKVQGPEGAIVQYEHLVLATGATPQRLPIAGADLPNVFTLRDVADAKAIDGALGEGKRLVVIGSSFIGMELVVAVKERKLKSIDVVGMTKVPFEAVLGEKIGAGFKQFHESNGVKFHGSAKVKAIEKKEDSEETTVSVELESGEKTSLAADVIVMAVGVKPTTEFLQGSGIPTREKDGGVEVDEFLKVKGVEGVYAIGDIAVFPVPTSGEVTRIEHWNVAQNHGRAVASGISGKPLAFEKTPVFWSAQGQQLRYVGHAVGFEDVIIEGNPAELKFVAYFIKGDKVLAVASMQKDPIASKCAELMRLGKMPSATEIRKGKDPLSIDISSSAASVSH